MNLSALGAVAMGGALGAAARYALVRITTTQTGGGFPIGHFAANVVGSVLIGVLIVLLATRADAQWLRLFLITGVLGAFTTFSAFSLDTINLLERGQWLMASGYVVASVALCIGGCALGMLVGRALIS
jgi:CrcB protein